MVRRWKALGLACAGALAVSLSVACGADEAPAATVSARPTASTSAPAAAVPAPTADPKEGWPSEIRLGYFGGDDADELVERVEPFRAYLEERLNHPVTIFTGTSYGAVIEAMRAGRVEGMQVGPFAYVLAVQEAKAEALAVGISCSSSVEVCTHNPDLRPHYMSVLLTLKGSGIETFDDLRGKSIAFVDPASTSGHLAPKTVMIKNGVDPDADMKSVFAGSHPTAVLALKNGNTEVAATYEGNFLNLINQGQVEGCVWPDGLINIVRTAQEIQELYDSCEDGKLVIIAQSDPIPSTPFAVRSNLPETLKVALRDAYLDIVNMPERIEIDRRWYVDPSADLGLEHLDQYYNSLRDIAKLLDLDLKELAEG